MLSVYTATVSFPLTPLVDIECSYMTCLRRIGAMDTTKVIINLDPQEVSKYIGFGNPMIIEWSDGASTDHFFGYVHSYKEPQDGYVKRVELIGISAAFPMVNNGHRSYNNVAIHNVAEVVADDYRFNLDADAHRLVRPQILQLDQTDWAFLHRLADEWGYIILFDGVTLIFRRQDQYLNDQYYLATEDSVSKGISESNSTITEFKPSYSSMGSTPISISTGYGVDPATGKIIEWKEPGSSTWSEAVVDRPVLNSMEAEYVAAVELQRSRFPHVASATFLYPFNKKPYDIYQITEGSTAYTWAVLSMKHEVEDGRYQGYAVLGTDKTDKVSDLPRRDVAPHKSRIGRNKGYSQSEPYIVNTRSYYRGTGDNTINQDQMWRAKVVGTYIAPGEAA